jgi:hypothetical protein
MQAADPARGRYVPEDGTAEKNNRSRPAQSWRSRHLAFLYPKSVAGEETSGTGPVANEIRCRPGSLGETRDGGSQGPPRRHPRSTSKKPRKDRAKDSASDIGASGKASAGGRKDGEFGVLPESAGLDQHMAYMKKHTGAIRRSMRVDLGSSWCVGYELTRIKDKLGLKGEKWDAHCKKVLPFTSRQARDYTVLAKAYSSAEEMIEKVGETVSFANAVLAARSLVNPDPKPEPKLGVARDSGIRRFFDFASSGPIARFREGR